MFDKYTYKQKLTYLLIITGVFLLIAYFLAIKKTLNLMHECRNISTQLEGIANAPETINKLERKIRSLEEHIGDTSRSELGRQQQILEKVGTYCNQNQLTFREFPSVHNFCDNLCNVETNTIRVEGNFRNSLGLVYYLEQKVSLGRLTSVACEKIKDNKTKQERLITTIYLQNITLLTNEK